MASCTERTRQATDETHPLNGHLRVVPRLKSRKSVMTCTKPIDTTTKAARLELWRDRLEPLDARGHLDISADEHLPAGAENPWTTWRALNRLRTQVGRSRVNMLKWGFSNEPETCDSGIRQTMQHLLVCPMMDTACSPQDLTTANDIAISCAKHWEGIIWRIYGSWWKDKNDDDCPAFSPICHSRLFKSIMGFMLDLEGYYINQLPKIIILTMSNSYALDHYTISRHYKVFFNLSIGI